MGKIGILGGTFNPIHNGHIMLADYCKSELGLEKVILIPTYTPPHKSAEGLVDSFHRINMCKIAVSEYDGFEVSDIETKRMGKSYSFETLTSLKELYPNDELYLIVGADMFLTLDKWKNPGVIFSKATIAAVPRELSDYSELFEFYNSRLKPMGAKAVILPKPVLQVSSSYIRANIENPDMILPLISRNVYRYIINNNLYRK